jgi:CheY-like chemotaxis protein
MPDHRILLVDDDPDLRSALARAIEARGHEVWVAGDALSALRRMQMSDPPPCFVFIDPWLPSMDGVTLLAHMQSRPDLAGIPALLLSASKTHRGPPTAARGGRIDLGQLAAFLDGVERACPVCCAPDRLASNG